MIDWGIVARAIHVAAVVAWIGGVSLVTTVLLPRLQQRSGDDWLRDFEDIEHRFAPQARIAVILVLLSGIYMLYDYDMWDRFADLRYWWMDLMVGVWLLFAGLLFLAEPLIISRIIHRRAATAPQKTLARMLLMHRVILTLSVIAILAAVAGSHGLF